MASLPSNKKTTNKTTNNIAFVVVLVIAYGHNSLVFPFFSNIICIEVSPQDITLATCIGLTLSNMSSIHLPASYCIHPYIIQNR